MKDILQSSFQSCFGITEGVRFFFAPGRVNLMGDHVDYNGGLTLPCALTMGTYAAVKKNGTQKIRLYSMAFPKTGIIQADLSELTYKKEQEWTNYPLGVVRIFQTEGFQISEGFDVVYGGTIPASSGLSSSASIEVVTAKMICSLYGIELSATELALLTQKAENRFVGVQCGILDQLSVAAGKKNYAIRMDTGSLQLDYAPLNLGDKALLIVNSNRTRQLNESKYNERRQECEQALALLQTVCKKNTLCEYTGEDFETYGGVIKDDILHRRARHVVYENIRTMLSFHALRDTDMVKFGSLMTASHLSLKEDYEVSCKETDFIVEESIKRKGVLGARMTGAGFGGCVVVLLEKSEVTEYQKWLSNAYFEAVGLHADFYPAEAGDGPSEV